MSVPEKLSGDFEPTSRYEPSGFDVVRSKILGKMAAGLPDGAYASGSREYTKTAAIEDMELTIWRETRSSQEVTSIYVTFNNFSHLPAHICGTRELYNEYGDGPYRTKTFPPLRGAKKNLHTFSVFLTLARARWAARHLIRDAEELLDGQTGD